MDAPNEKLDVSLGFDGAGVRVPPWEIPNEKPDVESFFSVAAGVVAPNEKDATLDSSFAAVLA